MHPAPTSTACLAEDELLVLAAGRALADSPAAEAHLASCATCSALLAAIVRDAPTARWDNLAGTTVGPYRLDAQIGAGGMGAVYRAWDPRLERAVAVKVLHTEGATRLAAEARAAAAISHPNVVAIHDVGSADGLTYVAMELVEGETLRSVLSRGPVASERVRELALDLANGLTAAHARGVIHRDLKPENLIVASDGRLRILDFGLAKLLDAAPLDETEPGTVQGTPGYMAPEQARGEPADARTDLFAVGAIVYELVTGRRAFPGANHADRLSAVLRDTPAFDGLGALAPIVERCLAKEPRDRFQSAADLAWALGRAARAESSPPVAAGARPAPAVRVSRRAVLAGTGAAALAGIAGYVLGRRRPVAAAVTRPRFSPLTARTGRVFTARFTHDGTHVVYGGAWDGEPLAAYAIDLASGGTRTLEVSSADVLAISPRSELALALDRQFVDHQSATGKLALVSLAGGAPRPLADGVQDADFAPDGTLAIVRSGGRGFRLELPLGNVLVETEQWLTHPRVSPDGTRIAYLAHPHTNDDAGDVMVVELATRATRALSSGWTSIAGLAWAPSGDTLWFTASRGAEFNAVRAVTLGGAVRRIADAPGRLRLHDLASDGRALVSLDAWRLRTLVGGRDRPDRDLSRSHISYVSDLSADGNTLAIAELDDTNGIPSTYLVPFAGGPPLRLGPGFPLAIAPSGSRVAVLARDSAGPQVFAYSTASADRPRFATAEPIRAARWIDDASLVATGASRLWRLSLSAPPVALTPEGQTGTLAIDPARRRCAFVDRGDRVRVIDLPTGAVTTLPGTFARQAVCGWLATPDAILVCTRTTPLSITRVDPATGAVTRHLEIAPPPIGLKAVDSIVIHGDGARYAYSYGQELSQLFVMTLES